MTYPYNLEFTAKDPRIRHRSAADTARLRAMQERLRDSDRAYRLGLIDPIGLAL